MSTQFNNRLLLCVHNVSTLVFVLPGNQQVSRTDDDEVAAISPSVTFSIIGLRFYPFYKEIISFYKSIKINRKTLISSSSTRNVHNSMPVS